MTTGTTRSSSGSAWGRPSAPAALLVFAATASVLVTAALRAWLGGAVALPVLSLPFLAAFQLALGAASFLGAAPLAGAHAVDASPLAGSLPAGLVLFVRSLGGLLCLPRLDAKRTKERRPLSFCCSSCRAWVTGGSACPAAEVRASRPRASFSPR